MSYTVRRDSLIKQKGINSFIWKQYTPAGRRASRRPRTASASCPRCTWLWARRRSSAAWSAGWPSWWRHLFRWGRWAWSRWRGPPCPWGTRPRRRTGGSSPRCCRAETPWASCCWRGACRTWAGSRRWSFWRWLSCRRRWCRAGRSSGPREWRSRRCWRRRLWSRWPLSWMKSL